MIKYIIVKYAEMNYPDGKAPLHHVMYVDHYGKLPPRPFALEHLGHVDYIPPFVPFENFVTVKQG